MKFTSYQSEFFSEFISLKWFENANSKCEDVKDSNTSRLCVFPNNEKLAYYIEWLCKHSMPVIQCEEDQYPAGIPTTVFRTCAPELALILTHLLSISYHLGKVPSSPYTQG